MALSGIDHWVMIVKDLEESAAFYQKLGLEPIWEEKAGGTSRRPIFPIGKQILKFYQEDRYEVESPTGAPNYGTGTMDCCLWWDGTVKELEDFLKEADIPMMPGGAKPRRGGQGPATSIYIRDPDGNLIEMMSYKG